MFMTYVCAENIPCYLFFVYQAIFILCIIFRFSSKNAIHIQNYDPTVLKNTI